MKPSLKYFIIILLTCLGINSCKKNISVHVSLTETLFDPVMKPFVFATGTYWIYEHTDTNGLSTLDSQFVTSVKSVNNHIVQRGLNQRYTGYQMTINSQLPRGEYNTFVIGNAISGEPDYSGIIFQWFQDTSTKERGRIVYSHYFDTLFLNGNIFQKVRQCDVYSWSDLNKKFRSAWVCPGVGIIKWETYFHLKKEMLSIRRYKTQLYLF